MPVSNTLPSETMEPEARKPLAQQTFAFWEGEENPRDPQASVKARANAKTQSRAKTQSTATSFTAATRTGPTCQALTRQAQGAEKRSVAQHVREKVAADETSPADSPSAGHEPPIAPQPIIGRESLMADLRSRAAAISSSPAMESAEQFSTGSPTVDTWLPGGGLKRGWICEWIAGHDASGASTLAMLAAASAIRPPHSGPRGDGGVGGDGGSRGNGGVHGEAFAHGGPIIVVDPAATFHAAAAIACGIPAERIVVCRCPKRADAVWTMDQALRCSSVAAVWATLPWNLNDRDARRLQLAAETGRTPGLLVLQRSARVRPSFAAVRFHVASVAVDASRMSADQRVAAGLPVRPPLDLRVLRVNLDRARGQRQNEAFLAVSPEARLHTLSPAVVAQLQHAQLQHTQQPTPQRITQTQPGSRHEAVAVPLAARLADPASTHRNEDADRVNTNRASTSRANTDRRVG
ncbi:MAG: ImuA family protein [Rhodopirellula sp. JB044]|uniref:ImuA family protein n=1 Tax=Rhodopirellula sp. JB044 TaxID=3342844 RepID=UPI00370B4F61